MGNIRFGNLNLVHPKLGSGLTDILFTLKKLSKI